MSQFTLPLVVVAVVSMLAPTGAWACAGCLIVPGTQEIALPLERSFVEIDVVGMVADVRVEQVFHNNIGEPVEAVYTFPLPGDAAVYELLMKVGDREIRGEIKKREEARQVYEQAREEGRQTALLDQERPDIFTTSVANIPPDARVEVHIRYAQTLPYDDGRFRLAFPMVVGPRYVPQDAETGAPVVDDTQRIVPHYLHPDVAPRQKIDLHLSLHAGVEVFDATSPSHDVNITRHGKDVLEVTLADKDDPPNRDFVLDYRVAGSEMQTAVLASKPEGADGTFLLMVVPRAEYATRDTKPKEMVFIIDTSGSMSGREIDQARQALQAFLRGLTPRDSFNIIRFSSDFSWFRESSVPFTQENLQAADDYIAALEARGGTVMIPPLEYALTRPADGDRLRMAVFITDGMVGNEAQVLARVQEKIGAARLFTLGLGSAPSEHFLRGMARMGRGFCEMVAPHEDMQVKLGRFQNRINAPILTDLDFDWGGLSIDEDATYPFPLPDLFASRPVIVLGRYTAGGSADARLLGAGAVDEVIQHVAVTLPEQGDEHPALSRLWAKARIEDLNDRLIRNPQDKPVTEQITNLGLEHGLMTQFTSFVVVDEREIVNPDGSVQRVRVPVPLPDTWESAPSRPEMRTRGVAALSMPMGVAAQKSLGVSALMTDNMDVAIGNGRTSIEMPTILRREMSQPHLLHYLARRQNADGGWGEGASDTSLTARVLLAFMASGHTDRAGDFQNQVRRGMEYVIEQPLPDDHEAQGMVFWCVSEAAALTGSEAYKQHSASLDIRRDAHSTHRLGLRLDARAAGRAAVALADDGALLHAALPDGEDPREVLETWLADSAPPSLAHAVLAHAVGGDLAERVRQAARERAAQAMQESGPDAGAVVVDGQASLDASANTALALGMLDGSLTALK